MLHKAELFALEAQIMRSWRHFSDNEALSRGLERSHRGSTRAPPQLQLDVRIMEEGHALRQEAYQRERRLEVLRRWLQRRQEKREEHVRLLSGTSPGGTSPGAEI